MFLGMKGRCTQYITEVLSSVENLQLANRKRESELTIKEDLDTLSDGRRCCL